MPQYENDLGKEISYIGHNNESIRVIFGAPRLVKLGLTAGGSQVSEEIFVNHVHQKSSSYSTICFVLLRRAMDGFRVGFLDEIYCKVVFQSAKSQKCVVFLTDPYYLIISMVK